MTHDLEGDLRDALLPLRDWETATGGAPDDLIAAVLEWVAPLKAERDRLIAERDGYRAQLAADWQARQITDLMKAAGRAHEERDQARAEVKRLTEMNEAATRLHAHALGTNDELRAQLATLRQAEQKFKAIGALWDECAEQGGDPYDFFVAVGKEVGDR